MTYGGGPYVYERVACPSCGRDVSVSKKGIVRGHRPPGGRNYDVCPQSWQEVPRDPKV